MVGASPEPSGLMYQVRAVEDVAETRARMSAANRSGATGASLCIVNLPLGGGFKHTSGDLPLQGGWRAGGEVGQPAPEAALDVAVGPCDYLSAASFPSNPT
jgi:hypothetical protein